MYMEGSVNLESPHQKWVLFLLSSTGFNENTVLPMSRIFRIFRERCEIRFQRETERSPGALFISKGVFARIKSIGFYRKHAIQTGSSICADKKQKLNLCKNFRNLLCISISFVKSKKLRFKSFRRFSAISYRNEDFTINDQILPYFLI